MPLDAEHLKRLIQNELARVHDKRVRTHIQSMLIEPHAILRDWDYGPPGQQYLCWMVIKDTVTFTEIGYCENGFGPTCPWGLVSSEDGDTMGMDSGWYTTLMGAYFESAAATLLPIWRVVSRDADGCETPLTEEADWDTTWQDVARLRANAPAQARQYNCWHTVAQGKPVAQ